MRLPVVLTLFFSSVLVPAAAHELELTWEIREPLVVVRSAYGASEPASSIKVEIYAPGQPQTPWQAGVTDQEGYFAFRASRVGQWRVVVDDGFGHKIERSVEFNSAPSAPVENPQEWPRWARLLTGLSALIGVWGVWYGYRASRSQSAP
jgi:nickel transport protein